MPNIIKFPKGEFNDVKYLNSVQGCIEICFRSDNSSEYSSEKASLNIFSEITAKALHDPTELIIFGQKYNLTHTPTQPNDVQIGATFDVTVTNLVAKFGTNQYLNENFDITLITSGNVNTVVLLAKEAELNSNPNSTGILQRFLVDNFTFFSGNDVLIPDDLRFYFDLICNETQKILIQELIAPPKANLSRCEVELPVSPGAYVYDSTGGSIFCNGKQFEFPFAGVVNVGDASGTKDWSIRFVGTPTSSFYNTFINCKGCIRIELPASSVTLQINRENAHSFSMPTEGEFRFGYDNNLDSPTNIDEIESCCDVSELLEPFVSCMPQPQINQTGWIENTDMTKDVFLRYSEGLGSGQDPQNSDVFTIFSGAFNCDEDPESFGENEINPRLFNTFESGGKIYCNQPLYVTMFMQGSFDNSESTKWFDVELLDKNDQVLDSGSNLKTEKYYNDSFITLVTSLEEVEALVDAPVECVTKKIRIRLGFSRTTSTGTATRSSEWMEFELDGKCGDCAEVFAFRNRYCTWETIYANCLEEKEIKIARKIIQGCKNCVDCGSGEERTILDKADREFSVPMRELKCYGDDNLKQFFLADEVVWRCEGEWYKIVPDNTTMKYFNKNKNLELDYKFRISVKELLSNV